MKRTKLEASFQKYIRSNFGRTIYILAVAKFLINYFAS